MTVSLQSTNENNRSVLVLTILHSGFVGRTIEYVNPISGFGFALVAAAKDSQARLLKLENKGFKTAEETDNLL